MAVTAFLRENGNHPLIPYFTPFNPFLLFINMVSTAAAPAVVWCFPFWVSANLNAAKVDCALCNKIGMRPLVARTNENKHAVGRTLRLEKEVPTAANESECDIWRRSNLGRGHGTVCFFDSVYKETEFYLSFFLNFSELFDLEIFACRFFVDSGKRGNLRKTLTTKRESSIRGISALST